jgi:sugar phosphate isomerase/epimerase
MSISKKLSRKEFLQLSGLALAGAMLPNATAFAAPARKTGVQLYTLREQLPKDLEGTLKKVAAIGYKEVELFGYSDGKFFGKTAKEFKALLKSLGLSAPSGHYTTGTSTAMPSAKGTLANDWNRAVADAAELGQKYMICAFLFPDERKTLDQYKRHIELFNKSAEVCKKSGIQFGYHNHDFEFVPINGQVPYDLILKGTDPKMVQMELDLYWTSFAKVDALDLFKKNPGRFPMWHVKDMEKSASRTFAEVGTGSIDFKRLFAAAGTAGLKHFFVEQDQTKRPPLESIEISYKNVQKLLA